MTDVTAAILVVIQLSQYRLKIYLEMHIHNTLTVHSDPWMRHLLGSIVSQRTVVSHSATVNQNCHLTIRNERLHKGNHRYYPFCKAQCNEVL